MFLFVSSLYRSVFFLVLSYFGGTFCLEWCRQHSIKRKATLYSMPLHYFVGSAPQLSALLCWLVLCVCVNDYHCLKLTDNRDNSRKGWFGTVIVCHRQATSPVQNVVFKGLFQNSEPATVFCFFCLNLTGSKFINIFQGPLILILHIVSTFLSLS